MIQSKNRHGRKIETVGEAIWSEKRLTIRLSAFVLNSKIKSVS
uniref:Uncharacterized protein n=1 Tax=Romanomermis culicivorax TaxID=13658 RepID=A0A915IQ65_ROMCU